MAYAGEIHTNAESPQPDEGTGATMRRAMQEAGIGDAMEWIKSAGKYGEMPLEDAGVVDGDADAPLDGPEDRSR